MKDNLVKKNKANKKRLTNQIEELNKFKESLIEVYILDLVKDVLDYLNIKYNCLDDDKLIQVNFIKIFVDFDEDSAELVISKTTSYLEYSIKDWHYNWLGFNEVLDILKFNLGLKD